MPTATSPAPLAAAPPTDAISRSPLPPPATFDFLPPLHTLLSRLLLPASNGHLPSNSPQINQPDQPLSPKDLAIAASAITAKIEKARGAVRSMEGVEMGLQEQEEIIGELEAEAARGKNKLENLRLRCAQVSLEDEGRDDEMVIASSESREDDGVDEG